MQIEQIEDIGQIEHIGRIIHDTSRRNVKLLGTLQLEHITQIEQTTQI